MRDGSCSGVVAMKDRPVLMCSTNPDHRVPSAPSLTDVPPLRFRCRPGRAEQTLDGGLETSMAAPASAAATWGPYFDAEFGPPHRVRAWIAWKISSTGVNIARRWWDQREELRAASIPVAL